MAPEAATFVCLNAARTDCSAFSHRFDQETTGRPHAITSGITSDKYSRKVAILNLLGCHTVRMNRQSLPPLAFSACALVWGTTFLAIRVGNESTPALWACTLRLVIAAVILFALHLVSRQQLPKGDALKASVLYGVFEFGIGLPLLYWGEKQVSSGMAAVLYAVCPVTAMFAARLLGIERLQARKVITGVVALAGVAIIFWHEVTSGASPLGAFAILIAAITAPFAGLMLQKAPPQNAITTNAIGATIGIIPSAILSFFLGESHAMPEHFSQYFPIVYLAIMSSGVAFVIFAWLMNHWNATTVSFIGVIVPVIAVSMGAAFNHEKFSSATIIGSVVVIACVVFLIRSDAKPQTASVGNL